jgi:hypothetical protein
VEPRGFHYNVEYAHSHGPTAPVVHGLQVLAFTAPGATLFPQYIGDVFIAFHVMSFTGVDDLLGAWRLESGVEHLGKDLVKAMDLRPCVPDEPRREGLTRCDFRLAGSEVGRLRGRPIPNRV